MMAALENCPTCQNPTSVNAEVCPKCGEPLDSGWADEFFAERGRKKAEERRRQSFIAAFLLLLGFFALVGIPSYIWFTDRIEMKSTLEFLKETNTEAYDIIKEGGLAAFREWREKQ